MLEYYPTLVEAVHELVAYSKTILQSRGDQIKFISSNANLIDWEHHSRSTGDHQQNNNSPGESMGIKLAQNYRLV